MAELWDGPPAEASALGFARVVSGDEVHELRSRLAVDGWVNVRSVPPGEAAVRDVVEAVGSVMPTVFGEVWELAAGLDDHRDSAYETTFLGPHTDGTYLNDAPGLQLFSCQERHGSGGESILVDGLAAACQLRRSDPRAFELLTEVSVPGRYLEPGVDLRAERPVVRLDDSGRLVQVSFNNLDRAPFWLVDDRWDDFIDAYGAFHALVNDRSRWLQRAWQPGELLLFNNWRLLHVRRAFTGTRRILGCYIAHGDLDDALERDH